MDIFLISVFAAGIVGHWVVYHILAALAKRTESELDDLVVKHCYRPVQWIIIFIIVRIGVVLKIPEEFVPTAQQILSIIIILLVSFLLVKIIYLFEEFARMKFDVAQADNLRARKVHTQLNVVRRMAVVVIFVLTLAMVLMTFEKVRQVGTTMLASAGIIGIVVGMAAQKTIGTFIAGLQIAFTQPIRLDDVVIVENEWGRIEEITLTYVVVRIWDQRRLIVPITYFIDKPFQNWTRVTADLLGTVYIYVDYTFPVERLRDKLKSILEQSEQWDKKVCVLQVTNATDRTVELRALVSASDASKAWSLRCHVREEFIKYIQSDYPESLPKARVELDKEERN